MGKINQFATINHGGIENVTYSVNHLETTQIAVDININIFLALDLNLRDAFW